MYNSTEKKKTNNLLRYTSQSWGKLYNPSFVYKMDGLKFDLTNTNSTEYSNRTSKCCDQIPRMTKE